MQKDKWQEVTGRHREHAKRREATAATVDHAQRDNFWTLESKQIKDHYKQSWGQQIIQKRGIAGGHRRPREATLSPISWGV